MRRLLIGIILSCVLIWLTVRGVDFGRALDSLHGVRYGYLALSGALLFLISFLRSLRWGIILSPVRSIGQRQLFPIFNVGLLGIVLMPLRLGEFARPYMLDARGFMPFNSALATVVVERVMDGLAVLAILLFVVIGSAVPPWLQGLAYAAFVLLAALVAGMVFVYFRTDSALSFARPLFQRLPDAWAAKAEAMLGNFAAGFAILADPARLALTSLLSLLIWALSGASIYALFGFQGLGLTILAAFTVQIIQIIGISLPTAPGMIGNFQYSAIVSLSLFGVPKDSAFAFSMVYYCAGVGMVLLLGLISLPMVKIDASAAVRKLMASRGKGPAPQTPSP